MKKKIGILGLAAMILLSFAGCDNNSGSSKPEENEKPTESCQVLLDDAVDHFANSEFDEGIANIEQAYTKERNDTTRMYYALAKLALISMNSDTLNFMRKTCGFESYPNKLNAIITEPWWEACLQDGFTEKVVKANPHGFNDALNQLVSILEKTYDDVAGISKDMKQASVTLPAKLVSALGLDEFFGSSEILMGKAELDVIVAATGLVKGALEYVSAFDWTFGTSSIKTDMNVDDFITAVQSGKSLFTTKNESKLAASKQSFVDAANLAISSYEYISGSNTVYPSEVKDTLKEYNIFCEAAKALKDALDSGKTFYVPDADIFDLEAWPTSETSNCLVKIDCGKAFSKGVFDTAVEKDSNGKVQFYTISDWWYDYYDGNRWNTVESDDNKEVLLKGSFYSVHKEDVAKIKSEVENKIPESATNSSWRCKTYLSIRIQIPNCISINGLDEGEGKMLLPILHISSDPWDENILDTYL